MSNHVHVVLRIDPETAATWTFEEVATRWVQLFPATINGEVDALACRTKEKHLLGNAERLETCRQRLGSLAWFMRSLNEPIARRANREDACTGRFWSGRYKCQALLDDAAVVSCISHVDLNPIRAGIADTLESSSHTSALLRIKRIKASTDAAKDRLTPVNSSEMLAFLPINTEDYLDLIDWTARLTRPDKQGKVAATEPTILSKLGFTHSQWHQQMRGTETRYRRAIGSAQSLIEKAAAMGQHWLKGIGRAETLMRSQPT